MEEIQDLLASIADMSDGDILNVIEAAKENEGSIEERLFKGYNEIV